MFKLPPHRDPQLEARYGRPHSARDLAGSLLLGILGFLLLLGIAALAVSIVR